MDTYQIIAQGIGIVAMTLNIISYQMKKQRSIIILQLFGATLFTVNMFMIGAVVGGFMNAIGAFRALVYANEKRFRSDKFIWFIVFGTLSVIAYALTFLVFNKEPSVQNLVLEFLPIVAMLASGLGFYRKSPRVVRRMALICSPAWLVYNIINLAIGGIICEILALVSIISAMIRLDFKKNKE